MDQEVSESSEKRPRKRKYAKTKTANKRPKLSDDKDCDWMDQEVSELESESSESETMSAKKKCKKRPQKGKNAKTRLQMWWKIRNPMNSKKVSLRKGRS